MAMNKAIPQFALRFSMNVGYHRDLAVRRAGDSAEVVFVRMIARLWELCAEGDVRASEGLLEHEDVVALCPGMKNLRRRLERLESEGLVCQEFTKSKAGVSVEAAKSEPRVSQESAKSLPRVSVEFAKSAWRVTNWLKHHPRSGDVSAGQSTDGDDPSRAHVPGRRAARRAARASAINELNEVRTDLLVNEQSRSVQELSRVAPPAPSPSPPGGGAAEPEPVPVPLGREKDQEQDQEPPPPPPAPAQPMTQAQRNPRLAGVDGADEVIPDWRDLGDRQVSSPEHVSTVVAGISEMLGQRNAKRRERERENLSDEAFESRRQAQLRALEAMDPACKIQNPESQNGEIHS